MNENLKDYPNSYRALIENGVADERPRLFDPSLTHFMRAFRAGDPHFEDAGDARRWHLARRAVIDHLLRLVAASEWSGHLVLRGSLLLQAWLGEAAREPGDIDWVFQPASAKISESERLFSSLRRMVEENPRAQSAVINADAIVTDDIWAYSRMPGRRIVFPWRAEGLPGGEVQMDVVFGEEMLDPPAQVLVPLSDGQSLTVWAASKPLSLAWKLCWLWADLHPRGKDLVDATILAEHLLAEQSPLCLELLRAVFEQLDEWREGIEIDAQIFANICTLEWEELESAEDKVDWKHSRLRSVEEEWRARLQQALAPTFADPDAR
jgi:hypothetical protein